MAVGEGLRREGIDVTTTRDQGLFSSSDLEQIEFARREMRVLVTQDADFLRLDRRGIDHLGICFYSPGTRATGEILKRLILIHGVVAPEAMRRHVEFL